MTIKDNLKIMVYGIDALGYTLPDKPLEDPGITIDFEPFNTHKKFYDYDGVILLQGIWAEWKTRRDILGYDDTDYLTNHKTHELSKRTRELVELMKQGGFIVFLMGRMGHDDYDLAKTVLNWHYSTYHDGIPDNPYVTSGYGELEEYFKEYGVAKTSFKHYGEENFKVLNRTTSTSEGVSICFDNQQFFLPYHSQGKDAIEVQKLFSMVSSAVVALYKKFYQEVPKWAQEYEFFPEKVLKTKEKNLQEELQKILEKLAEYNKLKKILCLSGDELRQEVVGIFNNQFRFELDDEDKRVEDFKIIKKGEKDGNDEVAVLAIVEVKGINDNVKNEHINKVDTHKERNELPQSIPGILIINTFIRSSQSVADKNKEVHQNQVDHAKKNNVLIMRTLDLINALGIIFQDPSRLEELKQLILQKNGWLEVTSDSFILHS